MRVRINNLTSDLKVTKQETSAGVRINNLTSDLKVTKQETSAAKPTHLSPSL